MNLTVNRRSFTEELSLALRNAEKQNLIPILSHVLLTANGDLRLAATDHEMSFRSHIDADISAEGAIALPARKLYEYVSQLSGESVSLELAKDRCTVSAGKNKMRLAGLAPDSFPELAKVEHDNKSVAVKASDLVGALARCIIVPEKLAGNTDYRTAVFLQSIGGKLKVFAIASHRLSETEIDASLVGTDAPKDYIAISERAAIEILSLAKSATEAQDATLAWNERRAGVTVGERVLTAQRLVAAPPAFWAKGEMRRTLPHEFSFNAQDMREVIALASTCARDLDGISSVVLDITEDGISVRSTNRELGETEQWVFGKSDAAIQLQFNAQYVQDFLAMAQPTKVTVNFKDARTTTSWRVQEEPEGFRYCVAPMLV